MSDTAIAATARRQHGLIELVELQTMLTRGQIRHRVATGRLERVNAQVLRVGGSPQTWEQSALAAVLAAGDGAVASFRAAAYVWALAGFWEMPAVEITTPSRRRARLHGVVVHDSEILDGFHIDRRRRIPVTSAARTLCDLTACVPRHEVGRALDDALRRKLTSLTRVRKVSEDIATRGRRKSTVLRALLDERGSSFDPGDSDREVWMVRAVVAGGLPRPIQQYTVRAGGRTFRLDGAYPEYQVGLEFEGFEYHHDRTAFDARYERDRLLKRAGWLIVYVTARTSDARLVDDTRWALESRGYPGRRVIPLEPTM